MASRLRRLILPFLALVVSACQDVPSAPERTLPAPPSHAAAEAPGGRASPYGCFVSAAMPEGAPFRYRYRKPELHFPKAALADDGATTAYRYQMFGANREEPVYVANCVIPATPEAVQIMHRKFGVRQKAPTPGEATLMNDVCVSIGVCTIDGFDVKACQNGNEWPNCDEAAPETGTDAPDATPCNAYIGDCGSGSGPSGGDSACTSCTPSTGTLSCTASVVRGGVVTCSVSADGAAVTAGQWRWEPDYSTLVTQGIHGPSGVFAWTGLAVAGGRVYLPVMDSTGATNTLTASFSVTPRTWRWSSADWSFTSRTSTANCATQEPVIGQPMMLGWHVGVGTCSNQPIRPDVQTHPRTGYTVQQVPWGPNNGLWYVTDAQFRMETESGLNPAITASGARRLLTNSSQAQTCRSNAPQQYPAGHPVYVNFWEFNERCKRYSLTSFLNGLLAHEGFGTTGSNGHESRLRMAAALADNDPRQEVEREVSNTEQGLHTSVANAWWAVSGRLSAGSDEHHVYVKNNWSGSVWMWNPSTSQYAFVAITPSP